MKTSAPAPVAAVVLAALSSCRSSGPLEDLHPTPATAAMPNPGGGRAFVSPQRDAEPRGIVSRGPTAELGEMAPDFELADLAGRVHSLARYRGKIVVLEWFDPQCPFVAYAYDEGPLAEIKTRQVASGTVWLTIQSMAPERATLAGDMCREFAQSRHLRGPILLDRGSELARRYGARTTPHLFVINDRGVLVYSGALDNAPMGRVERAATKTNFVEAALADLRSGHAVTTSSTRPYGSPIPYSRP